MNTFQKLTKSGKQIIDKTTKLPVYTKSINQRVNKVCNELGITVKHSNKGVKPIYTHDQRMSMIRQELQLLTA